MPGSMRDLPWREKAALLPWLAAGGAGEAPAVAGGEGVAGGRRTEAGALAGRGGGGLTREDGSDGWAGDPAVGWGGEGAAGGGAPAAAATRHRLEVGRGGG